MSPFGCGTKRTPAGFTSHHLEERTMTDKHDNPGFALVFVVALIAVIELMSLAGGLAATQIF
jgi:hypothetical protein